MPKLQRRVQNARGTYNQKLSRRTAIFCLTIIGVISGVLIWNVLAAAFAKNSGWIAGGFILSLLAVALLIEWMRAEELHDGKHWTALLRPGKLAYIGFVAIFTPLGVSQVLPLFDPGPLTSKDVRAAVSQELGNRDQLAQKAVLGLIPGLWGEVGCKSAYRFRVTPPRALEIIWERRPSNREVWRATATITALHDDRIETRGETPQDERGKAASFTYRTNGMDEQLTWTDEGRDLSMELVRCSM